MIVFEKGNPDLEQGSNWIRIQPNVGDPGGSRFGSATLQSSNLCQNPTMKSLPFTGSVEWCYLGELTYWKEKFLSQRVWHWEGKEGPLGPLGRTKKITTTNANTTFKKTKHKIYHKCHCPWYLEITFAAKKREAVAREGPNPDITGTSFVQTYRASDISSFP